MSSSVKEDVLRGSGLYEEKCYGSMQGHGHSSELESVAVVCALFRGNCASVRDVH